MRCQLDTEPREAYRTKRNDIVYVVGMQDFETFSVIVWVNDKRGYVRCSMGYRKGDIGFVLDGEFVYFSHFMNGDM